MSVNLKTALENPYIVIEDYFRKYRKISRPEDVAVVLTQDTIENILRTAIRNTDLKGFSEDEVDVEVYFSNSTITVTFKLPTCKNIETRLVFDSLLRFDAEKYKKFKELLRELQKIKERVEKEIEIKNRYGEYKDLVKRYEALEEKYNELSERYNKLVELVRQKLSEDEIVEFFIEREREEREERIRKEFCELFDDEDDYDDC